VRELIAALSAESLKIHRTLAVRLAVAAPLLLVGLLTSAGITSPNAIFRSTDLSAAFARPILTLWTLILLPMIAAIITTLLADLDHREHHWDQLFALPVRRSSIFAAKGLIAVTVIWLASFVLFAAAIAAMAGFKWTSHRLAASAVPVGWMFRLLIRADVASLLLIAILFWCSLRWRNFVVPLGVGVAGIISAIIMVQSRSVAASLWPWTAPAFAANLARSTTPLIIPAAVGIIVAVAACSHLARREWR